MVFEVDGTTEQLIHELQSSIKETILNLESGQREIKDLIDEVKLSCSGLATADQADLVSEDIAKARTAMRKLATAEQADQHEAAQGKMLSLIEQEASVAAEIKATLPQMAEESDRRSQTIIAAYHEGTSQLEKLLTEASANAAKTHVEALQALAVKMDTLSGALSAQMDKLSSDAGAALKIAEGNKVILMAMSNYLSLPGYKRFFKGMEVIEDEATK